MRESFDMLRYEQDTWDAGHPVVAGIDEAGRGPLAGPVVAAAVSMLRTTAREVLEGALARVNDSKQLTAKRREALYQAMLDDERIHIGIGQSSVQEIDQLNILNATHLAMARAVQAIVPLPDFALVDGRPVKGLPLDHRALIKGDSKSLFIAAASIVAKTHRDALLMKLGDAYPQYQFERHKGYGTKVHIAALWEYGPCPAHRRSFRPVREAAEKHVPQLDIQP